MINPYTGTSKFTEDQIYPTNYYNIKNLKEGEFSKPFETFDDKGNTVYKIIFIKSKVMPHQATIETDYQEIQDMAMEKKYKKAYDKWIAEKSQSTYIKIDKSYKTCPFEYEGWLHTEINKNSKTMIQYKSDVEASDSLKLKHDALLTEIKKVVFGQREIIEQVLTVMFAGGHCLLVGVPGLAKTLLVNTIAKALDLKYKRIQFTPDLMPSDITGSEILDENKQFKFVKGPVFANIILADEINRTPPKTQSALLEAMQEHTVTVSGNNYKLEEPFFVLATQNPVEQEGTYPLPEAQLDRFMFNVILDYPSLEDEITIVKNTTKDIIVETQKVVSAEEILYFRELIKRAPVADNVIKYAVSLVAKTRPKTQNSDALADKYLNWGAGPRASQYLITGAKTYALLHGKYSPDIDDVKAVALPVLRHRIIRNYQAEAEGLTEDDLIKKML